VSRLPACSNIDRRIDLPNANALPGTAAMRYQGLTALITNAAKEHRLAVLICTDKATGAEVPTLCEVTSHNGQMCFRPVAKFFTGNAYEELAPPKLPGE
jgi:hypothetical protein